ncbi:glycoside hydrolase family 76 protein [Marinilabilia salmonicolor]|uniref:glycoside hydrolase family 76 protein n=1 Tax=Marinilabilia salmonicolor TaxID=989 RepID=UPI00029AF064|nr:glycoside hydrolase family 76 protein [Marinilabilia salmonicolor]
MRQVFISIIAGLIAFSCGSYEDEYIEVNQFPDYSWVAAADSSTPAFVDRYWNTEYHVFNNTFSGEVAWNDYWPEAHGLDVLVDAYIRTGDERYKTAIYNFYEGVKAKNWYGDTWRNEYYDDMGWHGMAHMRAYEATGDERYKESAEDLWYWITQGWTDYQGGGIKWREQSDELEEDKGIPANGPAAIIAARRYQKYPDEVIDGFNNLEWAVRIYEWMKYNRMVLSTGRIYEQFDNTNGDYSYDVGTFIGAAIELYNITGEQVYMRDAIKAARYHISANVNSNNRVMTDFGEQAGNNGGGHDVNLFKGIFVRYFTLLIQHPDLPESDRNKFIPFLENNANYLWTHGTEKEADIKFSYSWWEYPGEDVVWGDLRSAISGATMIEAMARLENDDFLK